MIYVFSDLMAEWNNDEISKLIDFIEKRLLMCVIRHFSGARNCDELASKFFVQVSGNSFCYQFLVPVSVSVSPALRHRHLVAGVGTGVTKHRTAQKRTAYTARTTLLVDANGG